MASCFQPSHWLASHRFYCWIPSYRVNREFFTNIWQQKSRRVVVIYFCIPRFCPSPKHTFRYYGACWLLTASVTPSWYLKSKHLHHASVRPHRIMTFCFSVLYPLHLHQPFQITTGLWFVWQSHPRFIYPIWSFFSLRQMSAAGLLRIPPRNGHPCPCL